jgi:diacylglycerol kinase (ATP)
MHSADRLEKLLEAQGHDVDSVSAKKKRKLKRAVGDPGEAIVVAGGDGTVRRCILRSEGTPLVILPLGKGNNVAKSLGILDDSERIIEGLAKAKPRTLDLGCAAMSGERMRFVEGVGAGLVSRLIEVGADELERRCPTMPGAEMDRPMILLRELLRGARPERWRIEADGVDVSGSYLLVEVLLMRLVGPNLPLAPDAAAGDGLFRIALATAKDRAALDAHFDSRLRGFPAPLELERITARRVRLRGKGPLHVDDQIVVARGEAVDCTLEIEPGALKILVSPPERSRRSRRARATARRRRSRGGSARARSRGPVLPSR